MDIDKDLLKLAGIYRLKYLKEKSFSALLSLLVRKKEKLKIADVYFAKNSINLLGFQKKLYTC